MYEAISVTNVSVVCATVTGFVEQKFKFWISSDYLFVIEVFWSNNSTTFIKRSYSDFVQFHASLTRHFKSKYDNGIIKTSIYIPHIQGKRTFLKNCIEVAERREYELNEFVKKLLQGNPLITNNQIVLDFFTSKPTDPISDQGPSNGAKKDALQGITGSKVDATDSDEDDIIFNKD